MESRHPISSRAGLVLCQKFQLLSATGSPQGFVVWSSYMRCSVAFQQKGGEKLRKTNIFMIGYDGITNDHQQWYLIHI